MPGSPTGTSHTPRPRARAAVVSIDREPQRSPLRAADVMRAGEVAALLHVPVSTVHDWARRGVLPSRKLGRHRLYIRQQIETLLLDEDASHL